MAKVTGPLFSLTARNTIGKSLTYSSWRGIPYVRTRVIPANPETAAQVSIRELWKTLNNIWNRAPALFLEPWQLAAVGKPFTDRNRFLQLNIPALDGDAVLNDFAFSPGSGGALPPLTAAAADGGAQVLNLTLTQPATAAGWVWLSSTGIAILQGDPDPAIIRTPIAAEDAVAPFTLVAITVPAAGTYVWGAWNVFTAPDGTTRCSIFITGAPQAIA